MKGVSSDPIDIKKIIWNIMNHALPTNLIPYMKWTKSLKKHNLSKLTQEKTN